MAYDVKDWLEEINLSLKRNEKKWWKKADRVIKRYRDERESERDNAKKYNILWSNVETLKPALYNQPPKPEVRRRFKDNNPVARQASMILERALEYSIDSYDFDGVIKSCREDYLLPGRAVSWGRYVPTYGDEITPKNRLMAMEEGFFDSDGNAYTEEQITFDTEGPFIPGEPYQPVAYEEAVCEYVYWKDFIHGDAKRWEDVTWVARAAYMSREELMERFGEKGRYVKLNYKPDELDEYDENKTSKMSSKGRVWEIWDKTSKRVYWVSDSYKDDFLDESEPPLNVHGFFPCTKPLYAVSTNDTMDPIPEYCMYQDQAQEIDTLTTRIGKLLPAIRVAGAYPGGEKNSALGRMLSESSENRLYPVDNWAMFAERGGVEGMISWLPIEQITNTVVRLYEAREKTKQELYEITGLADIIRGASVAAETATAQRIKGQFATLRLSDRQRDLNVFIRDALRLKAEIMCEHFSAETFQLMTGLQVPPEVMELFRNDPVRGFMIDIETDSTIMADEQEDKQSRVEFLEAVTGFIGTLLPIAQQAPAMAPLLGEMILFGVRGFKAGRQLEESIEQALQMMQQQAQQAPQQQPDPKQIEAEARAQKLQQEMQMDQAKLQQEMQIDQAKLQHETQLENAKFQQEARIKQAEFGLKERQVEQDIELQRLKARLGNL